MCPVYKRDEADGSYGLLPGGFNVRWSVDNQRVMMTSISSAAEI
jgi:hypothetical protein